MRARENIVRQLYDSGDQEIGKTIERIRMRDSVTANTIRTVLSGLQLHLIMNKVQESAEERFVTNLQQLARKYAEVELNYLGSVPYDDNVKKSLNEIVPFALEYEMSPANGAFRTVAHRLDHAVSDVSAPDLAALEMDRLTARQRLAAFVENTWTAALAPFQPKPIPVDGDFREYDLKIRKLTQELTETKQMHEKEKRAWLQEKEELSRRFDELMSRQETAPESRTETAESIEEPLRQRDEFIEELQAAARKETSETRRALAERDARIEFLERKLLDSEERIRELESGQRALPSRSIEPDPAPTPALEPPHVHEPQPPTTVREQILSTLARHSANRITIVQMEEGGMEVARFAGEVADVLGDAGWVINSVASSFKDSQFNGLKLIHDDTPNAVEGARVLGLALLEAGIEHITQRAPFPTEFERIRLVVGRNGSRTPRTLKAVLATADLRQV